jgi:pathogenesis-related protein 1
MRGAARWLSCTALAIVLLARSATPVTTPCQAGCKAGKKACVRAANAAFTTTKTGCAAAPAPADRRSCKHTARATSAAAKASCKAMRVSCLAECAAGGRTTTTTVASATSTISATTITSTTTTTTTTLPGPSCGDVEAPALAGITFTHDAVRANPSLDSNGVSQPTPNPALSPLCYSSSVAATAQGWADQCMFMHNPNRGNLGENIYASTADPSATTPPDAVTLWAAEAQYYDYASNACSAPTPPGTCGHYTQVVWRDTTALGCGIRACTMNSPFAGFVTWTFVVCDYQPPGNVSICDSHGQNCVLQRPY